MEAKAKQPQIYETDLNSNTKIMASTPSTATPRRPFNSEPVESPFPCSPLSHNNNKIDDELSSSSSHEKITTIFQLFNPTLSGYLTVETFEVMMLSLGYRVTRQEIVEMVQDILSERDAQDMMFQKDKATTTIDIDSIDLDMAIAILHRKGYLTQHSKPEEEAQMYFRLFDVQNKGCINVKDLKRVQSEAVQLEQNMLNTDTAENVTDEFLQAILEKFDLNSTGDIDFEEFRRMVHPILS